MRFTLTLLLLLAPLLSHAQAVLPACADSAGRWHQCTGSLTYSTGVRYFGQWKDGKRSGFGTVVYLNGSRYVGQWQDDSPHGLGIEYGPDGKVVRSGQWSPVSRGHSTLTSTLVLDPREFPFAGERSAAAGSEAPEISAVPGLTSRFPACGRPTPAQDCAGMQRQADGSRYVGEFRDGLRNGQGIEYRSDGSVERTGFWESGELKYSFTLERQLYPFGPPAAALATPTPTPAPAAAAVAEASERKPAAAEGVGAGRPERRIALLIGNSSYRVSPLENPANDAADMDAALRKAGFQTTLVRNATLGQMREATRQFAERLPSSDVALIYFAGHGIESNRRNYLIPVNADLKFEYELSEQAYDASVWLEMLEGIRSRNADRVNIMILDACRNNSLIGSRSMGRGLGRMDAPTGTFLAYSTAPGKVAADGGRGERNSPFTKHLLTAMQQPGLPIEEVFKEVRRQVTRETGGAQVPWESTSLTGFFAFLAR